MYNLIQPTIIKLGIFGSFLNYISIELYTNLEFWWCHDMPPPPSRGSQFTYCASCSFFFRALILSSISWTSPTNPYWALSRHSSTLGRYVRFSNLAIASFNGFSLSLMAFSRSRMFCSCLAISSSVCEVKKDNHYEYERKISGKNYM